MGTMFFARVLFVCLIMKLTDGQNLSAARMTEIFRTTKANDADIAELLTNVNFEETAEGKQKAAIQWIRQKLTARDKGTNYEEIMTLYIGNLSLAHNYVMDVTDGLKHDGGEKEDKLFEKLKKRYLRNVERYGNDVWCALARFWVETFYATPSYSKRSQVLEKALKPYPPKRKDFYRWEYLKDVRAAFKTLAWEEMYQYLGFGETESDMEKLFKVTRRLQLEKFGF